MLDFNDIKNAAEYEQCGGAEYFEKMYGEIQKSGCKTVCFKIFGTLILPPFSDSGELFLLMEEDFRSAANYFREYCPKKIQWKMQRNYRADL